jgi:hypothetical protein
MKESDWKKFKLVKDLALERFCAVAMTDFEEVIKKENSSNHEKYLYLYKLVQITDKRLGLLFDGHSRSKAQVQLMFLRSEGLAAC